MIRIYIHPAIPQEPTGILGDTSWRIWIPHTWNRAVYTAPGVLLCQFLGSSEVLSPSLPPSLPRSLSLSPSLSLSLSLCRLVLSLSGELFGSHRLWRSAEFGFRHVLVRYRLCHLKFGSASGAVSAQYLRQVTILYGSETGNSEEQAKNLMQDVVFFGRSSSSWMGRSLDFDTPKAWIEEDWDWSISCLGMSNAANAWLNASEFLLHSFSKKWSSVVASSTWKPKQPETHRCSGS